MDGDKLSTIIDLGLDSNMSLVCQLQEEYARLERDYHSLKIKQSI